MDQCIDFINDTTVCSGLNTKCEYLQIKIAEADCDMTTFTSHHKFYRLIPILFGPRNAPGTFQHKMDVILSVVKRLFAHICLDDIVVAFKIPGKT